MAILNVISTWQRPSDGYLVLQTRNGDRSAFDELIVRYQRPAVAVASRLLGNVHDAMEVTQDAFLNAFTNLATLRQAEAFGGWLMRIVSNLSLNFRRARKTRAALAHLADGAIVGSAIVQRMINSSSAGPAAIAKLIADYCRSLLPQSPI